MTSKTQDIVPVLYTNWGRGTNLWGPTRCPVGEHVSKLEWWEDDWMQRLNGTCSGGSSLAQFRNGGGWYLNSLAPAGGWDGISVQANHAILGINGIRHTRDIPETANGSQACLPGQKIVGYHGKHSDQIDSIGVVCDYTKEYCENNLESEFCREHPHLVDTVLLNKACEKNMTNTCRDRKKELNASMVRNYCTTHLNDDLCSCDIRNPKPPYIKPEIAALRQCWNDKCSSVGYRFNDDKCPAITICQQDIKGQDNNNMLSGNVQLLDCGGGSTGSTSNSAGNSQLGGTSGGTNGGSSGGNQVIMGGQSSGLNSTMILIIVGVLLAASGIYYVTSKSSDPGVYVQGADGQIYQPQYQQQYQPQYSQYQQPQY